MLSEWLAPSSVQQFLTSYYGRAPHARPGVAAAAIPLFDWAALERGLRRTNVHRCNLNGLLLDHCSPQTIFRPPRPNAGRPEQWSGAYHADTSNSMISILIHVGNRQSGARVLLLGRDNTESPSYGASDRAPPE